MNILKQLHNPMYIYITLDSRSVHERNKSGFLNAINASINNYKTSNHTLKDANELISGLGTNACKNYAQYLKAICHNLNDITYESIAKCSDLEAMAILTFLMQADRHYGDGSIIKEYNDNGIILELCNKVI